MSGERLEVTLPSDTEVMMTRWFGAPRRLVFDAFTQPELVRRWLLGPEGWTMPVCEIDLRVGGAYRYGWRNAEGHEFEIRGEFRELSPPERIVHTELFDDGGGAAMSECADDEGRDVMGGAVSVVTTEFAEREGRTLVTMTIAYPTPEIRDQVLGTGMSTGVEASYARLDEILPAAV